MADASVRPARPADAEAVAGLQLTTWQTAYAAVLPAGLPGPDEAATVWREAIQAPPSPAHHVLVALENEIVVGFAATEPDEDGTAVVAALLVEPRWNRRGHGSRLLAAVVDHARLDRTTVLLAWVLERDGAAIGFYESAGWQRDGWVRTLEQDGRTVREVRLHTSIVGDA